MAKEKVKLEIIDGDTQYSKVFIILQDIKNASTYTKAKETYNFINRETKVLTRAIETHLRNILRENGCLPYDGTNKALERALNDLEYNCRKRIRIIDRYENITGEKIVGYDDETDITIIEENGVLTAAVEVEIDIL